MPRNNLQREVFVGQRLFLYCFFVDDVRGILDDQKSLKEEENPVSLALDV